MPTFIIYCHTHIASGKRYVGQTQAGLERRWDDHVRHASTLKMSHIVFSRAIRKYGPDAFSHEVLQECVSRDEANVVEVEWIARLNTRVPYGYNLDAGGKVLPKHEITRARMSAGVQARWDKMTAEERSALRRTTTTFEQRSTAAKQANAARTAEERSAAPRDGWAKLSAAQRSEIANRRNETMTAEQRSERSRRARMSMTPEARSEQMRKANAARTPEARSAASRRQWLMKTPEERSAHMKAMHAARTPEQRSDILRRGWATRRAKSGFGPAPIIGCESGFTGAGLKK